MIFSDEKVMVCHGVVDLRKGAVGLLSVVADVELGTWYLFSNRSRDLCKAVCRDRTGCWVVSRRLHRGLFAWPESASGMTRLRSEEVEALCCGDQIKRVSEHFCS